MELKWTSPGHSSAYGRIVFYLTMLYLSGCVSSVNMLQPISTETPMSAQKGLVVARVVNASGYSLPFNQLTIAPEDVNQSKAIKPDRLLSLETQSTATTVFASQVNPGSYAVIGLRSFHVVGERWYQKWVPAGLELGVFNVKPGETTDLGTLIYYPKSLGDKYTDLLLRAPHSTFGEVLKTHFPFYLDTSASINSWSDDGGSDERQDLFASVAQNPVAFASAYQSPRDSIHFLARLGVIIERQADEEWSLDAIPSNMGMNAIAINEYGFKVVGGEEGQLYARAPDGEWSNISFDSSEEILDLSFHSFNALDVLVRQDRTLRLLRTNAMADQLVWSELDRYDSIKGWYSSIPLDDESKKAKKPKSEKPRRPKRIGSASFSAFSDEAFISVTVLNSGPIAALANGKTQSYPYHPVSGEVQSDAVKDKITNTVNAGAVTLGIKRAGFWSWDGRPNFYRYEQTEKKWKELTMSIRVCPDGKQTQERTCPGHTPPKSSKLRVFNFRSVPKFTSDTEAVAVISFQPSPYRRSDDPIPLHIYATSDGGLTWRDTGNSLPEKYCSNLVPLVLDRLLVSCNGASGDFYQSFDSGATWEHIRQQENF